MPSKEDIERWNEDEKLISGINVMIFGFDISKLSWAEQQAVKEATKRRWELEAELERRNPTPKRMTKEEELELRHFELQIVKLQKQLERQDRKLWIKERKGGVIMDDIYKDLNETEIRVVEEVANKGGRTYEEIAKKIGISDRHLYRIRQKPHIKKAIKERTLQAVEEDVPDILGALRKNAKRGDFRSIELVVKMLGLIVDRSEVKQTTTIEDNRFKDMTQEDIDEELAAIEKQLKVIQGGAE